jgi:hypothetical protein
MLAIIAASAIVIMMVYGRITSYEQQIEERDLIIADLTARWEDLGPAVQGLVVAKGVRGGQEIRADNWTDFFEPVLYPERLNLLVASPDLFQYSSRPSYIRASMQEGTILTTDDVLEERLIDSHRYYDVILDEYPIGMLPGTYIDIRIRFPFGQDFIALSHRKVMQLNGSVIKLIFSEQDIYTYSSMLTDKVMYGAQLYAVEYIDVGSQQAADVFYPLNNNQQDLLLKNPNALDIVREEMRMSRELLEAEMLDVVPSDLQQRQNYYQSLQQSLEGLRASNTMSISQQQAIFIARWEYAQRQNDDTSGWNDGLDWQAQGPVRG